jgi:signal transduction histidine kinase
VASSNQANRSEPSSADDLLQRTAELDSLLRVASHDLRGPLMTIQGFAYEIEAARQELAALSSKKPPGADADRVQAILSQEIPEALGYLKSAAAKIETVLNGLVTVSRLSRMPLEPTTVDMNVLIGEVLESLRDIIQQKGVSVDRQSLPACRGDASLLRQLFAQLIDNAAKYLHSGRPAQISITGSETGEHSVYVVADNGPGLTPVQTRDIFEPFRRLQPDDCAAQGLGLTLAQRIAARHDGKLWVESEPGIGSRFFVSLPTVGSK